MINTLSAPLTATLEVTWRCNLNCLHCLVAAKKVREISTKNVKRIIKQLADANVFTLAITGGEPFLRKDIEEIVRFALGFDIRVHLNTNGLLLKKTYRLAF